MTRPNITTGPWINNADTVYMGQKPAFLAVCSPWNHPQSVANARAIAAVPALLEALEFCHKFASFREQKGEPLPIQLTNSIRSALIAAGYQF